MSIYENQNNYPSVPYPSQSLPNATIKSGGCGCVSSVNVLRFFGIKVSVPDMAQLFISKGIRINGGTDMNKAAKYLCDTYNLELKTTTDENVLKQSLLNGCVAIANVDGDEGAKGIFSSAGHFINVIGYDNQPPKPFVCFDVGYYDGKFNDSYRKQYVSVSKDSDGNIIQFTSQEALNIDTANRNPQYWIFSKKGGTSVNDMFKDVKPDDYAYKHILKLKNAGIVNGDTNGNYNPDMPITRRDMAIVVANVLSYIGK